jgi:hypothetical protein
LDRTKSSPAALVAILASHIRLASTPLRNPHSQRLKSHYINLRSLRILNYTNHLFGVCARRIPKQTFQPTMPRMSMVRMSMPGVRIPGMLGRKAQAEEWVCANADSGVVIVV